MNLENSLRYTDYELKEFRGIIETKIQQAKDELADLEKADNSLRKQISINEMNTLIARQLKYIQNLRVAITRIDDKTYGICRATGKLISKERLKEVPHATLSISQRL